MGAGGNSSFHGRQPIRHSAGAENIVESKDVLTLVADFLA